MTGGSPMTQETIGCIGAQEVHVLGTKNLSRVGKCHLAHSRSISVDRSVTAKGQLSPENWWIFCFFFAPTSTNAGASTKRLGSWGSHAGWRWLTLAGRSQLAPGAGGTSVADGCKCKKGFSGKISPGHPAVDSLCLVSSVYIFVGKTITGWWFGTFFIFPYIGNNHPNWLIFFRGVQTTNQFLLGKPFKARPWISFGSSSFADWYRCPYMSRVFRS